MHYDIDRMHIEGGIQPAIGTADVYRSLERDGGVLASAKQLLTHADPAQRGDDRTLVAHLVAIATNDPHCAVTFPPAYSSAGQPWRRFVIGADSTLAVNLQDIRICNRMTPVAMEGTVLEAKAAGVRPEIAEQMGLHGQCMKSKDHVGPRPRYGPQEPVDDEQTLRLFKSLGVAMPSAHDWPAASVANYYRQYVFALWPSKTADPARDAARSDLVRRLLALNGEP